MILNNLTDHILFILDNSCLGQVLDGSCCGGLVKTTTYTYNDGTKTGGVCCYPGQFDMDGICCFPGQVNLDGLCIGLILTQFHPVVLPYNRRQVKSTHESATVQRFYIIT